MIIAGSLAVVVSISALIYTNFVAGPSSSAPMTPEDYKFMEYIVKHGKSYATVAEYNSRAKLFKETEDYIKAWNADHTKTSTLGHNQFSDFTMEEKRQRNGFKSLADSQHTDQLDFGEVSTDTSSNGGSIDWRERGAVTPVKNQKVPHTCGCCYAFVATAAVESAYAIKHGTLKSFSEQQIVDCSSRTTNNNGCVAGTVAYAFNYIKDHPLVLEGDYPYTASAGYCKAD